MLSPKWDIFSTTALQGLGDITEEGAERLRELEGGVKAVKCLKHTRDLTATAAAWIGSVSIPAGSSYWTQRVAEKGHEGGRRLCQKDWEVQEWI